MTFMLPSCSQIHLCEASQSLLKAKEETESVAMVHNCSNCGGLHLDDEDLKPSFRVIRFDVGPVTESNDDSLLFAAGTIYGS
jgi:hypothetical protein